MRGVRLLERLDLGAPEEITCLHVEDHADRVRQRGLVAVADAVCDVLAEIEVVEGLRVHRSWCVGINAIAQV